MRIDPRFVRKIRRIIAPFRRVGLKKQFTIFSNNCWGGRVYDKFGLTYLTPTIGLAMSPSDFIKFCLNYENYLKKDLNPIESTQKRINSERGFYDCTLGDIVVCFRHYKNAQDAIEKWNRRKKRVIKDNIIAKLSYYTERSDSKVDKAELEAFAKLPFKKIVITNNLNIISMDFCFRVIYLPISKEDGLEGKEFRLSDKVLKTKEIKKIVNSDYNQ